MEGHNYLAIKTLQLYIITLNKNLHKTVKCKNQSMMQPDIIIMNNKKSTK